MDGSTHIRSGASG